MIAQLSGAAFRAFLVGLLVAMPSLMLGSFGSGAGEIAVFLSLIAATGVFLEYRATYPSFVEFRDAPPINRIRFSTLMIIVFLVSLICAHPHSPSALSGMVTALASALGAVLEFPYSPVRMVLLSLPEGVSGETVFLMRAAAGVSYVVGLGAVALFFLVVRTSGWPVSRQAFNVWINMPLFDPTAGGDVVQRLQRDARINIVLGVLLPFLIPAGIRLASHFLVTINLNSPHLAIWLISVWAFVPASMIIRGIALHRISDLIEEKRQRTYASPEHLQTA